MKILNQLVAWNSVLSNSPSHGESWPPCSAQDETTSQGGSPASDVCVAFPQSAGPQQPHGETPAMLAPFLSVWEVEWRGLPPSGGAQGVRPRFLTAAALSLCPCDQTPSRWAGCRPAAEGGAGQRVRLLWPPCQLGNRSILLLRKSIRPSNHLTFKKHTVRWHDCPIQITHARTHTHKHTERSALTWC